MKTRLPAWTLLLAAALALGACTAIQAPAAQTPAAEAAAAFDLQFIDSMIPHHEGAVVMARQALEQAEREEIKQMAQQIIDAQEAEIQQLQAWRAAWYGDAPPAEGMPMEMGHDMEHGADMAAAPAGDQPFDLHFIDAMIPHHEDAIRMAQEALTQAEHEEIKQLAEQIIAAQQAEIEQMQAWRAAWHPDE